MKHTPDYQLADELNSLCLKPFVLEDDKVDLAVKKAHTMEIRYDD